jgi:FG-GAP repeat
LKTLNYLAFVSLAVPGRERMESIKRRTSLAWLILALLTGLLSLGFAGPAASGLPAQGEAALAQLKEQGLYDSLQEALATARYGVYPEPQQLATWHAENPAQQIRVRFTPEGVQVQAKPGHGHPGRIGMKLRSVGYGERPMGVSAARLTTSGSRIEYRRSLVGNDSAAGTITEWYVNTAAGLEQGFTLQSAPGERRDGERLRVVLALEGELGAQAVEGGQALEFKDGAGQRVLRYDHLAVRDGAGRELEARMAVRMERGQGEAWLEVDDRDAVWPVTIDPTFTQQQKLEASDAASPDQFGTSVAISGETVVVGAPVAGGYAGSAYVFVRSGGVWSQQQKLAASDAAAGDQFGNSVAISGETVVVGAPVAGGYAGSASVLVRSGRV